jgi:hypothetical protein
MKLKQLLLLFALLITTCLLSFSLFAQPTAGLMAYWRMDGNYVDAGPNLINGTNFSSTATTNNQSVANKAMAYANLASPVVQFATHPINANLSFGTAQDFSIDFSLLTTSQPHPGGIYDNNLNYGGPGVFMWSANGFQQINFNFKNGNIGSTNGALPLNVWKHICCVRAGTAIKIYINGVLNATGTASTTAPVYNFVARFGTMFFNSFAPPEYNGHNGKIDEFRIYNRALSNAEIAQLASFALPLKLGDFTATKKPSGIQLNWETISEQNTSYFEIERSTDGINFVSIGRVNANGNSATRQYYSFTDVQPSPGTNFYRLKMADNDAAFTLSRIIAVKNENSIRLQVFPNPVSDVLQVQLPSLKKETVTISITDAAGKSVYTRSTQLSEGNNASSIPVQHLSKGTYFLIVTNKEERQSIKFIKQ